MSEEEKKVPAVGATCAHKVPLSESCSACAEAGGDIGNPEVRSRLDAYFGALSQGDDAGAALAAVKLYESLGVSVPEESQPKKEAWRPTCQKCLEDGKDPNPIMYVGGTKTAAFFAPFHDELGNHQHDNNRRRNTYCCAQGHQWTEQVPHACPNPKCGWMQELSKSES